MGEVGAHNISLGTSITVVRWHGYERGLNPQNISRSQHFGGWSGTAMREVGARKIAHGASTAVVG